MTFWAAIIIIFFTSQSKVVFPFQNSLKQSWTEDACRQTRFISPWNTAERRYNDSTPPPPPCPNKRQMACTSGRKVKDVSDKTLRTLSRFWTFWSQAKEPLFFRHLVSQNLTLFFLLGSQGTCSFLKQVLFTDQQPKHSTQSKKHHPQLEERDANCDSGFPVHLSKAPNILARLWHIPLMAKDDLVWLILEQSFRGISIHLKLYQHSNNIWLLACQMTQQQTEWTAWTFAQHFAPKCDGCFACV